MHHWSGKAALRSAAGRPIVIGAVVLNNVVVHLRYRVCHGLDLSQGQANRHEPTGTKADRHADLGPASASNRKACRRAPIGRVTLLIATHHKRIPEPSGHLAHEPDRAMRSGAGASGMSCRRQAGAGPAGMEEEPSALTLSNFARLRYSSLNSFMKLDFFQLPAEYSNYSVGFIPPLILLSGERLTHDIGSRVPPS